MAGNDGLVIDLAPPPATVRAWIPGWISAPVGVAAFVALWLASGRTVGEFMADNALPITVTLLVLMFLSVPRSRRAKGTGDIVLGLRMYSHIAVRSRGMVVAEAAWDKIAASAHWYDNWPALALDLGSRRPVMITFARPGPRQGISPVLLDNWPAGQSCLNAPPEYTITVRDWTRLTAELELGGLISDGTA